MTTINFHEDQCIDARTRVVNARTRDETCARAFTTHTRASEVLLYCSTVNSRKKRFVNPIKIEVTRRARTETNLGKSPAIPNGHQPP